MCGMHLSTAVSVSIVRDVSGAGCMASENTVGLFTPTHAVFLIAAPGLPVACGD